MRTALLALVLLWLPVVAPAQTEVDLELVLLADSSGSIDDTEIAFQRQGYAAALTDPEVVAAIEATLYGRIGLTYIEWAAANSQQVVVDWQVIGGAADAADFAQALMLPPRQAVGRNAIGAALLFGKDSIEGNGLAGWRRIIDFSADSANNHNGPGIAQAREVVLASGITINGLAVACRSCPSGQAGGGDLEQLFAERIIGGPGAFVVTADNAASFADAVRRKLILEISGLGGAAAGGGIRLARN